MKSILKAATAMIGIIGIQIVLAYTFSYQAAEIFTKVSLTALFFYYICKIGRKQRRTC